MSAGIRNACVAPLRTASALARDSSGRDLPAGLSAIHRVQSASRGDGGGPGTLPLDQLSRQWARTGRCEIDAASLVPGGRQCTARSCGRKLIVPRLAPAQHLVDRHSARLSRHFRSDGRARAGVFQSRGTRMFCNSRNSKNRPLRIRSFFQSTVLSLGSVIARGVLK